MATWRWIAISYGIAFLALLGVLGVSALCAALVGFIPWLVPLLLVPVLPGWLVGRLYRQGMTRGASSSRPVLLALVVSWLLPGALSAYLGYATISWILFRAHPEIQGRGLLWYAAHPGQVRTLHLVRGGHVVVPVSGSFVSGLGAVLALVAVAAGLRNPSALPGSVTPGAGDPDPAAFLDQTVLPTHSGLGQRIAGAILAVLASGGIVLLWRAPSREHLAVPALVIPVVLVFGLGLLAWPLPSDLAGLTTAGDPGKRGSHFPMAWVLVPLAGIALGLCHWWLLMRS